MASLLLDDIDDDLQTRLRQRAIASGRSPEAEARAILRDVLAVRPTPTGAEIARSIHELFAPLGGVDLQTPSRTSNRQPPEFRD